MESKERRPLSTFGYLMPREFAVSPRALAPASSSIHNEIG